MKNLSRRNLPSLMNMEIMVTFKPIIKPTIKIEILDCSSKKVEVWNLFKRQHYLTGNLNKSSRCFLACWNGIPVGFYAVLAMPCGSIKRAWRGHRLVVLADYQGLGIGNRLAEWVAQTLVSEDKRFFAKTANIKLGEYRNNSPKWRPTSKNMIRRKDHLKSKRNNYNNIVNKDLCMRICYSHEYVNEM